MGLCMTESSQLRISDLSIYLGKTKYNKEIETYENNTQYLITL